MQPGHFDKAPLKSIWSKKLLQRTKIAMYTSTQKKNPVFAPLYTAAEPNVGGQNLANSQPILKNFGVLESRAVDLSKKLKTKSNGCLSGRFEPPTFERL